MDDLDHTSGEQQFDGFIHSDLNDLPNLYLALCLSHLPAKLVAVLIDLAEKDKALPNIDLLRRKLYKKQGELIINLENDGKILEMLNEVQTLSREKERSVTVFVWGALDERLPTSQFHEILIRQDMSQEEVQKAVNSMHQEEMDAYMAFLDSPAFQESPEGRRQSFKVIPGEAYTL